MTFFTGIWAHARELLAYRHEPERLRALADLYWRALLLVAAGIIVFMAAYGSLKLLAALESGASNTTLSSESGSILFNRTQLEETLDDFTARRVNYELLKKNPPAIADPSR